MKLPEFKHIAEISFKLGFDTAIQNSQNRDNLFSANHRNAIKQRYGYTSAEWVTIEELLKN
jgi:hypothetical protein